MKVTADQADRLHASQYQQTTLLDETTGAYVITTVHGRFQHIDIVVPKREITPSVIPIVEDDEEERELHALFIGIYSGFTYSYNITFDQTDGPPPLPFEFRDRLHDFNPTIPCREAFPQDFDPDLTYQPVTRLVMESDTNIRNYQGDSAYREGYRPSSLISGDIEQSNVAHPCSYSGPMARIVSLALGNGNFNLFDVDERLLLLGGESHSWYRSTVEFLGFRLQYDWHADRIHSALQDNKGNWWLIEIHEFHGIVARPLPMIAISFTLEDDLEQAAIDEFGGLPSGEAFPNDTAEINDQIENGDWIRLMSVDDYQETITDDEIFFSQACGWVFNDTGTEGRVVTYNTNHIGTNWLQAAYWKLELSINTTDSGSSGTATITKIEENIMADGRKLRLNGSSTSSSFSHFPIYHYHPENNQTFQFNLPTQPYTNDWDDIEDSTPGEAKMDFPIWVGWIDGEWHEINYRMCKVVEWEKNLVTAKLWPLSEADGDRKMSIEFAGKLPYDDIGGSNATDPEWVLVSSYAPGYNLGAPLVFDGEDHNGTIIDVNEADGQWTDVTTRLAAGSGTTDIYKIKYVRNIYYHTEAWSSPAQNIDFIMVPYHRNAYYIRNYYSRPAKKRQYAMQRTVYMYANRWTIANSKTSVHFRDPFTAAPPWESFNPGDDYNWAAGPPPAFWHEYPPGHGNEGIPGDCDSSPTDPPSIWYVTAARGITPAGLVDAWGPAEDIFTEYCNFSAGWFPTPACGPINQPDSDSSWREDSAPRQGIAARQDGVHETSIEEERQEIWLVADRTPTASGTNPFSVGIVNYEDDYTANPTFQNMYLLQTAMLGKKSMIYADVSQITYSPLDGWPWFYPPIEYEGTQPEVLEDGFNNIERRWLTYIGVNNP
jgi:hypothetical protein